MLILFTSRHNYFFQKLKIVERNLRKINYSYGKVSHTLKGILHTLKNLTDIPGHTPIIMPNPTETYTDIHGNSKRIKIPVSKSFSKFITFTNYRRETSTFKITLRWIRHEGAFISEFLSNSLIPLLGNLPPHLSCYYWYTDTSKPDQHIEIEITALK